jgi:hypothetical protein
MPDSISRRKRIHRTLVRRAALLQNNQTPALFGEEIRGKKVEAPFAPNNRHQEEKNDHGTGNHSPGKGE